MNRALCWTGWRSSSPRAGTTAGCGSAHWSVGEIIATDLDGHSEVMAPGRQALGWSIDWLPDGRMLVTGESLLRQEPDGSFVPHADLTGVARHNWNEIVVDHHRGNVYLNGADTCQLPRRPVPAAGIIALVAGDGTARRVAEDINFPNGMVITPDGSTLVVAEVRCRAADRASTSNRTGR